MYNAEVLSKFPVVQHFPFGSLFSWEQDPNAAPATASVHTTSQPTGRSMPAGTGITRLPPQESTVAPWAKSNVGGVPATAAPWAHAQGQAPTGQSLTRAPWAGVPSGTLSTRSASNPAIPPPSQMQDGPTRAPWASTGGSGGG